MYAVRTNPKPPPPPEEDNYVFFYDMTWKDFEVMLALRGETAVPRMSYLDGVIELMSPSKTHEYRKKTLARLLEVWALETELRPDWARCVGAEEPGEGSGRRAGRVLHVSSARARGSEVPDLVIRGRADACKRRSQAGDLPPPSKSSRASGRCGVTSSSCSVC